MESGGIKKEAGQEYNSEYDIKDKTNENINIKYNPSSFHKFIHSLDQRNYVDDDESLVLKI